MKKAEIKKELKLIINNFERTRTLKPLPPNILFFDNEDTWNKAMDFKMAEIKHLLDKI